MPTQPTVFVDLATATAEALADHVDHFNTLFGTQSPLDSPYYAEGELLAVPQDSPLHTLQLDLGQDLAEQARGFALLMGLAKLCQQYLTEMVEEHQDAPEKSPSLRKLAILLDLAAGLEPKTNFYTVLQTAVETLAAFSTRAVSAFWQYLEARVPFLKAAVFSPLVTLNRIAILSICNNLTERHYARKKSGRLDLYEKDSFNDELHARVRHFLAAMLDFDDLTGLNKHFTLANRETHEHASGKARAQGTAGLLADAVEFCRLVRDPYTALRKPYQLSKSVDAMVRLQSHLLDAETKHAQKFPVRNATLVAPKEVYSEMAAGSDVRFFPEHYWLAPFESVQQGAAYEEVLAEDEKRAMARFQLAKFRRFLLVQIYFLSSFFLELQESRKRAVLKNIGAKPATKHIVDDATPEKLIPTFRQLKRDIFLRMKSWDSQLAFLLQHLATSEEYWWAWLIYGKDRDGNPLVLGDSLPKEDLAATQAKFDAYAPYKTKKYFNTHATPQLSRRMKTPTGIDRLRADQAKVDYALQIEDLTRLLEATSDPDEKAELFERRMVVIWQSAHQTRAADWFSLRDLDKQYLEPKEEPKEEPKLETESPANGKEKQGEEIERETDKLTVNETGKETETETGNVIDKEASNEVDKEAGEVDRETLEATGNKVHKESERENETGKETEPEKETGVNVTSGSTTASAPEIPEPLQPASKNLTDSASAKIETPVPTGPEVHASPAEASLSQNDSRKRGHSPEPTEDNKRPKTGEDGEEAEQKSEV